MSRDLIYENIIRPILFNFDPEEAHNLVHSLLTMAPALSMLPCRYGKDDLRLQLFGTTISNPVGLAAGFDKNGALLSVLGHLGFGFAEIGSVCARPHGGNVRPRLFRLPQDEALINRLGLNGLGAEVVATRVANARISLPIGINIAKTNDPSLIGPDAVADILYTFVRVRDLPVSFFTINASCPNTKEGCLKETDTLASVFAEVQKENSRKLPVLVKLSPDSTDEFIEDVVSIATASKLAGYVCGNTTIMRSNLQTAESQVVALGAGGLSGRPLRRLGLELCRKVFRAKHPDQVIIGAGGVSSGEDAYEYIRSGASAVELYTSMVYRGPTVVRQICDELSQLMGKEGTALQDLIGSAN